ncbi:MAG: hypothetical protein GY929_02305 [Actinomycetia bacterium]|nr:hypothetical protein [Actinomycetes bacterium]
MTPSSRSPYRVDRWSARVLAAAPDLLPYGLERHRRAECPIVQGAEMAHRGWTRLGTIAGSSAALVDPRGLVVPHESGWSLDWWVGADDRWYHPSTEGAVAQGLVENAPVVATTLRVPGGDIVHQVGAVRHGSDDVLLVEVTNQSALPVALALALRSHGAVGPARVENIRLDGTEVIVDGNLALRFPRPPARSAFGSWIDGDVVDAVVGGDAGSSSTLSHHDPEGTASAAFIVPLTHGTTQRFVLPVGERPRIGRVGLRRRPVVDELPAVDSLPPLERVAAGWASLADGGTRIVTPDTEMARVLAAGRGHLLRAAADLRIDGQPVGEAVAVADALGRLGHADEAAEILTEVVGRQRPDGSWGDTALTRAAVASLGGHLSRCRVAGELADTGAAALAAGAHVLEPSAGTARAVEHAVAGLRRVEQSEAAEALAGGGVGRASELQSDPSAVQSDPAPTRPDAEGFYSVVAQARRVADLVAAGDTEGFMRLGELIRSASATMTWPELERPDGVRLARGEGHSALVQALVAGAVLDLLVRETPDGLDLFPLRPESWEHAGVEVHDLPTRWGRVSVAVRWHGERPALLWSVDDPVSGLVLRAPVLDPSWSTTEPTGETLLG